MTNNIKGRLKEQERAHKHTVSARRQEIHGIPDVIGTGITTSSMTGVTDEDNNVDGSDNVDGSGKNYQVIVLVERNEYNEHNDYKEIVSQLPGEINGYRVVYHPTQRMKALTCDNIGCRSRTRPLVAGCSVGHPSVTAGTLGGFPRRISDEQRVILSNNHVIALQYPGRNIGKQGDPTLQPGPSDGGKNPADIVGTLEKWIEISATSDNEVDSAYSLITSTVAIDETAKCNYDPGSSIDPEIGMSIKKSSRTKGCCDTEITVTNLEIDVGYSTGYVAHFVDQLYTTANFVAGGDSGSLAVDKDTNNAVGLVFAGNGIGECVLNKIKTVESKLGVYFGTTPPTQSPGILSTERLLKDAVVALSMVGVGYYAIKG